MNHKKLNFLIFYILILACLSTGWVLYFDKPISSNAFLIYPLGSFIPSAIILIINANAFNKHVKRYAPDIFTEIQNFPSSDHINIWNILGLSSKRIKSHNNQELTNSFFASKKSIIILLTVFISLVPFVLLLGTIEK